MFFYGEGLFMCNVIHLIISLDCPPPTFSLHPCNAKITFCKENLLFILHLFKNKNVRPTD